MSTIECPNCGEHLAIKATMNVPASELKETSQKLSGGVLCVAEDSTDENSESKCTNNISEKRP